MKLKVVAAWPVTLAVGLLFVSVATDAQMKISEPAESAKTVIGPRNPLLAEGADAVASEAGENGAEAGFATDDDSHRDDEEADMGWWD